MPDFLILQSVFDMAAERQSGPGVRGEASQPMASVWRRGESGDVDHVDFFKLADFHAGTAERDQLAGRKG